jgi:hypothetical protein
VLLTDPQCYLIMWQSTRDIFRRERPNRFGFEMLDALEGLSCHARSGVVHLASTRKACGRSDNGLDSQALGGGEGIIQGRWMVLRLVTSSRADRAEPVDESLWTGRTEPFQNRNFRTSRISISVGISREVPNFDITHLFQEMLCDFDKSDEIDITHLYRNIWGNFDISHLFR